MCFKKTYSHGSPTGPTRIFALQPACRIAPMHAEAEFQQIFQPQRIFTQPAEKVCLEDRLPGLGDVAIGSPLFIGYDIWKGNVALFGGTYWL